MNNSRKILLYILVILLSVVLGMWFYNNYTWVVEEKDVGFQGIAKTNRLLASEFFLRKMGVKVQQVNGLVAFRNLPSVRHTLLIATQRETLNKELSQNLLTWVRSGGHLIVEARYLERNSTLNDSLLEELQVFLTENNAKNEEIPVIILLLNNKQNAEIAVKFPSYTA